jgi:hypothetical protein
MKQVVILASVNAGLINRTLEALDKGMSKAKNFEFHILKESILISFDSEVAIS